MNKFLSLGVVGLMFLLCLFVKNVQAQNPENGLQLNWQKAISLEKSNPGKSLVYAQKAYELALIANDELLQAKIQTLMGNIYGLQQNRADKAAEYHRQAFDIYNALFTQKLIEGKALYDFFLENVTPVYQLISDEEYNRKRRDRLAIRKYQELYTELSQFFLENEVKLAKNNAPEAKKIRFEINKDKTLSNTPTNSSASLELTKDILNNKILSEEQKKLYDDYISNLEKKLTQKGVDIKDIKEQFIRENNQIKHRVHHLNLVILRKDSVGRQDSIIHHQQINLYKYKQKMKEAEHLNAAMIYRRNLAIFGIIAAFLMVLAFIFYRNSRVFKRQNNQIEEQNKELIQQNEEIITQKEYIEQTSSRLQESYRKITDNIAYTQTIQSAILPQDSVLKNAFTDHFVLYLPKDIVSGDFYWFHQTISTQFIAVVDCTGHGVSGGFMSMIGYMLLNKIIVENKNHNLSSILEELDLSIQEVLQQKVTNNTDGMAISICKIETLPNQQKHIQFCGSKQSLFYNALNTNEIQEIKGDRYFIGGDYHQNHTFNVYDLNLKTGDTLYLTTDGLIDQNDPHRKKFTREKLCKLLNDVKDKDLITQKKMIHLSLNQHQAESSQRDDITIIGLKL
jgi:serine phosphatase RsbU (regulator of sigma subunit)